MSEPEPVVRCHMEGGVARVVLNRPDKRNALNGELIDQLARTVGQIGADASARLVVLSAEGPAFCAGMDLSEMQQRAQQRNAIELWQQDAQIYRDLLAALITLPMPTLAVVGGPALAGGLGLVLACDVVLASDEAFFSLPEPQRGITAAVVAPLLIYRIGAGPATYLLLSGERVCAADAHSLGLCHEVVSATQLTRRESELCSAILAGAPSAQKVTKQHILAVAGPHLLEQLDAGMTISAKARETDEAREGLAAFLEKRQPVWQTNQGVGSWE